jgi:hypothetical protein
LTQSEVLCCQRKNQAEEDAVFAMDLLCCLILVGMLKSPGFSTKALAVKYRVSV